MSETGRIIRKFERMLGTSNIHEVRPDTKGALRDEIELSEERSNYNQPSNSEGLTKIADVTIYLNKDSSGEVKTERYPLNPSKI
jgi:hypothetical protein